MPGKRFNNMAEAAFLLGTLLIALGTTLLSRAGFGMSMVVAPAYVLSAHFPSVSDGTMCYLYYGVLVATAMGMRRRFCLSYLFSFFAAVLFGLAVDAFAWCMSFLPEPSFLGRVALYLIGVPISALSIALLLHSYFPPQPPELFVKTLAAVGKRDVYRMKYLYDIASLLLSAGLSLLFFRQLRFIGPGTFVAALVNGPLIGYFGRKMEKIADFSPLIPALGRYFSAEESTIA